MYQEDVVLASEGNQLFEQLYGGVSTSRHIGVVHEHQLHAAQILLLDLLEVGVEAVSGIQAILHNLAT